MNWHFWRQCSRIPVQRDTVLQTLAHVDERSPARTAAASNTSAEIYWPQLDGLRTLAFMLVFLGHAGGIPGVQGNKVLTALNQFLFCGTMGVDVFFALSGFLITSLLLREKLSFGNVSYPLFYARRALRIWPVYFIVLIAGCVVVPLVMKASIGSWLQFLVAQFLPLALFVGNFSLIYGQPTLMSFSDSIGVPLTFLLMPFWSLCIEEQFYIAWPLTINKLKTPARLLGLLGILTVVSCVAGIVLFNISQHSTIPLRHTIYQFNTVSRMLPLIVGAAIAVCYQFYPRVLSIFQRFAPVAFALMCGVLVVLSKYSIVHMVNSSIFCITDLWLTSIACGLMLGLTLLWNPLKAIFSNRLLMHVGRMTYCMYLIHYFVQALVSSLITICVAGGCTTPGGWLLKVSASLAATYLLALLSWNVLEKHFNKMRRHYRRA